MAAGSSFIDTMAAGSSFTDTVAAKKIFSVGFRPTATLN